MNSCEHPESEFVPTPELIHHGKNVCVQCGAFLGWAKKPETIEKEKRNAAILAMLETQRLTEWEKGFVLSLEKQGRHFSPKQQETLDNINLRYGYT